MVRIFSWECDLIRLVGFEVVVCGHALNVRQLPKCQNKEKEQVVLRISIPLFLFTTAILRRKYELI